MARPPAAVLASDSSTDDASEEAARVEPESTVGESYLFDLLDVVQPTNQHAVDSEHEERLQEPIATASVHSNDRLRYSAFDQQADNRSELQVDSARRAPGETSSQNMTQRHASVSNSQPVEGPGGCGEVSELGYLGAQTQAAQSLDTSWDKKRRRSADRSNEWQAMRQEDPPNASAEAGSDGALFGAGSSRVAGPDEEEEVDQLASSVEEDDARQSSSRGGGDRETIANPESQKENANLPRSPLASTRRGQPFIGRNSRANLEPSASVPSSSPFDAQQLLHRSPAKRPPRNRMEPSSSTTTGGSPAGVDAFGTDVLAVDASWEADRSISRPFVSSSADPVSVEPLSPANVIHIFPHWHQTSTPGAMQPFPPAPAPTQALETAARTRSIPPYRFIPKETVDSARSMVKSRSPPPNPTAGTTASAPDLALFASSAAMARPAPRGRKKKEEWDGISQDTPEEKERTEGPSGKHQPDCLAQDAGPESADFAPTQIHDSGPEEENDRSTEQHDEASVEEREVTPRPTAERTVDMELDDGISNPYLYQRVDEDDAVEGRGTLDDDSTINGDLESCSQPKSSAAARCFAVPTRPANDFSAARSPHTASTSTSSPSRSQRSDSRIDSSAQEQLGSKKRLSEISELRSSQELPPTQFEVEATQKVYDVEKSQLSVSSADINVGNSASWHAPFANEDSKSTSHSRQRSNPPPGRGLRRVPPAPTPVDENASARSPSPPFKQSLDASAATAEEVSQPTGVAPATESLSRPRGGHDLDQLPTPPAYLVEPHQTSQFLQSSPEVPLARNSLEKRASSTQSRRASPRRQPKGILHSPPGALIPDSEDPTQSASDEPTDTRPSKASTSKRDNSEDVAEDGQSISRDDIGVEKSDPTARRLSAGSKGQPLVAESEKKKGDAKESNKSKSKGEVQPKRVEWKATDREDRVATGGRKRARRARLQESAEEAETEDEDSRKTDQATEAARRKGKEKMDVDVSDGKKKKRPRREEQIDSGSDQKVTERRGRKRRALEESSAEEELSDEADDATQEEAKRSAKPKAGRSRKKPTTPNVVRAPTRAPSSRKASGPSIIEQTDDEAEEDAEGNLDNPRNSASSDRKRKSSVQTPGAKQGVKRAKRAASTGSKKTATSGGASRSRRTRTESVRDSVSAEPARPVAGPSRLRFADQESGHGGPTGEDSSAATDSDSEDDNEEEEKPVLASRLPSSAPFTRCFGMWRDDGYYYPASITGYSKPFFQVTFDDGSKGKLRPDEVRRCELACGDWIEYCGAERNGSQSQSQAPSLTGDLRVLSVRRGGGPSEDEPEGQLDKDDVILVVEAGDFDARAARGGGGGRTDNVLVEAIRIIRVRGSQFNNRKCTLVDLEAFEGKARPATQALPLLATPKRPSVEAFKMNDLNSGTLSRTAFLITYAGSTPSAMETSGKEVKKADKERLLENLKSAGATVVDWGHLFESRVDAQTGAPIVTFPTNDFAEIDTILLLADRSSTTMKFLIALALGIPCCSIEFAQATFREGTRIDWESYLLPAGYLDSLSFFGVGGQLRALRKPTYDLDSLRRAQSGDGVFKDQSFLVILEKPGKSKEDKLDFNRHAYVLLSLLSCCSASRIDFLALPFDSATAAKFSSSKAAEFVKSAAVYSHVFLDFDDSKSKMEAAVKPLVNNHKGIVNMDWVKQCLVTGRLQPAERIRKARDV